MWLHQADIVCGTVIQIPVNYDNRSEVVCNKVGWGRRARNSSHQTSHSTEPSSGVENNLGATDIHGHTTPTLLQSPREMTLNTPVAYDTDTHLSHEYHVDEEEERIINSGVPREAVGNPPRTQQFMSGIVAFQDTT